MWTVKKNNFKHGFLQSWIMVLYVQSNGPGSVVGIATGYGLDGPGSNAGGGEIICNCPDRPWDPPSLLYNGYRVFPGDKKRPGRNAEPSPLLVPWSWKSRAITLLPLWAVRPVQILSACKRVHFIFTSLCAEKSCAKLKNDVPINRDNTCYITVIRGLVLL